MIRERSAPMTQPLSDEAMLTLGRQYLHMADRKDATERDQAALRDFVPALLHRLHEKTETTRALAGPPVLDLRFYGLALPEDDQLEMRLPQPD